MHSSNTVTLLQQWKTLLDHHNVTDISANNRASCIFVSLAENKPKLQSSCQYLLLLWDLLLWVKVIRCGCQENWHRNQLWVVKYYVQRDVIFFQTASNFSLHSPRSFNKKMVKIIPISNFLKKVRATRGLVPTSQLQRPKIPPKVPIERPCW